METKVQLYQEGQEWDEYVRSHETATFFHQMGYKRVIEESFSHKPYYLIATEEGRIAGILPLFVIRSWLSGTFLVSLPFCDHGGVAAEGEVAQRALLEKAIEIAERERAHFILLRHRHPTYHHLPQGLGKVNLRLPLASAQEMWRGFKDKVRNQVRKAQKEGLEFEAGGIEKLERFYRVFCANMRDLGTPVYPLSFFRNLLETFPNDTEVLLVNYGNKTIGGAIAIYFKDSMEVPWASSLRRYFSYCPNNLLYWEAIKRGGDNGLRYFDFGRSSKGSGPYLFKKQWGAQEEQLFFQYVLLRDKNLPNLSPANPKFKIAIELWKRMPLSLTNWIGPYLSKYFP